MPLGQGVGGRVDAASPVLRNGRHVGGALPCVVPETGIVDQLGRLTGSGCPRAVHRTPTGVPRTRAARCVPVTAPVRRSSVSSSSWWGVVHNTPSDQAASTVASASGSADPTACTPTEAEQGPGRAAAPGLRFDAQRRHAHRLRGHTRQVPQHRHRSRAAIPRPSDSARRSTSPEPSDCNRSASLSSAPNSPSSVPRFARQRRSQTQITALGIAPNAVIGEP
jgi:hypothetical protein